MELLRAPAVVGERCQRANGLLVAHYTQGIGLTSRVDAVGSSEYYAFDDTGNTAELTGNAGAILNSYSYLPFGAMLNSQEGVANPLDTYLRAEGKRQEAVSSRAAAYAGWLVGNPRFIEERDSLREEAGPLVAALFPGADLDVDNPS